MPHEAASDGLPATVRSPAKRLVRGRQSCLLMSGGLDSALCLRRLLRGGGRVWPVYMRCGFAWERAELYWLRRLLRVLRRPGLTPLQVIELPLRSVYGPHWSLNGRRLPRAGSRDDAVYLPGRNILLISHAAILCARRDLPTIVLGTLRGSPFGDASPRCLRPLARSLSLALRHPMRIATPLSREDKASVVRSASGWPIHMTFSCLRPRGRLHCGRCNKCAERQRAFRRARVADPTRYASRP